MRRKMAAWVGVGALYLGAAALWSATEQDIQTKWASGFNELPLLKYWIYQDLQLGINTAAKLKKPMMIVFR